MPATIELTADELARIVSTAVANGVSAALAHASSSNEKSTNAARCARYRERKAACQDVSKHVESMSKHVDDTVSPPPSSLPLPPSPPLALLSPTPPILPSPSPPSDPLTTPTPTAALEKPRKAKKEQRKSIAADANAEPIPASLGHAVFAVVWLDWCEYRTEMAMTQGIDWTPRAARLTLAECARHGTAMAVAALRRAMARNWRGLVWKDLEADAAAIESYELVAEKVREPEPEEDLMALLLANRAKTAAREAALATPHNEEESREWN